MVYRIKLAKLEEIMFVSHLGTMRAFERAVRRARLPVAYSGGYHPHPKISFATALGVGMTSEAEYVDIELMDGGMAGGGVAVSGAAAGGAAIGSRGVLNALAAALPPGLKILAAAAVLGDSRAGLASGIRWASYRAQAGPGGAGAAERLMAMHSFEAELEGKAGAKTVDIRPMVKAVGLAGCAEPAADAADGADALEFTIACGGRAHLRPGDFIAAVQRIAGACADAGGDAVHRTGLFFDINGKLVEPMACECTDLVRS